MTVIERLQLLGFQIEPNTQAIFTSPSKYAIVVDLRAADSAKFTIHYGEAIKIHHKSTSNLSKPENWVVLECVIRLLNKGYAPHFIELEKTWKLGHQGKGRLDIFLRKNAQTFALIECKTRGEEYAKERNNILEDGGQLLSYFIQERSAEHLVLYSSHIDTGGVIVQSETINATSLHGANTDELFTSWDKSFQRSGIFDLDVDLYGTMRSNLRKKDLKDLDRSTGKGVFNSFAEILRRHVVSDKSNAFNKIFNLFVCKIFDEDRKRDDDELAFQWKHEDTPEKLLERLTTLYKRGLDDYLNIKVSDTHFSALTEFAFIDIFNEATFHENAAILQEIVELLQGYRIKYSGKHQFLGDFFEKLLNTGIKQEAGQFFTPIPLARFILKSLPIASIIQNKIAAEAPYILPYVLDYACGSGHFLTEAMDEIEQHIHALDSSALVGQSKRYFEALKQDYLWAKEYIYGIDLDYRLAKTSKVASFLNGDGDAVIIHGDGLDDFYTSRTYVGKLKAPTPNRFNPQFDVVVANPPFSISGFKRYVQNGARSFALYKFLSAKSSEIECLFIERLSHVLVEGGVAGVILPLSILNSDNRIYLEARKKLLIEFDLCALVELREKTFIATNTTTVVLFLRKRPAAAIRQAVKHLQDVFVNNSNDAAVKRSWEELQQRIKPSEQATVQATIVDALKAINDETVIETTELPEMLSSLLSCILNAGQTTLLGFSGEKKTQERFLGYRFSSMKGNEGIHYMEVDGRFTSLLYDSQSLEHPDKINTYIRAHVECRPYTIPEELLGHLRSVTTNELTANKSLTINNPSGYFESETLSIESNSPFGDFITQVECEPMSFENLMKSGRVHYHSGLTYSKEIDVPRKTKNRLLTASNLDLRTGKLIFDKIIYLKENYPLPPEIKPRQGDIIISNASGSLKHLGKCVYVVEDVDAVIGGFLAIIRPENEYLGKALFYRLLSREFRTFVASLKDQNINNLNLSELFTFRFQLPNDLKAFYEIAIHKERELAAIEQQRIMLLEK